MKTKSRGLLLSWFLGAALVAGLLCVRPVNAQVLYGTIVGTVTDQSGAVLPGAQVTATNEGTGLSRQATTNTAGQYQAVDLPEGSYAITVSATGFRPFKRTAIRLVIGQVNQQDVQMQVGGVTQEVTVQATAVALQTQKTDVHTTISSYAVQNLPLNLYHNFQSLEILAPGVFSMSGLTNSYPNAIADAPDRSFAINTNGLPQHINTSRVDGATNVFLWLPDHMVIVPPAATVAEVNVQTATYDVAKGLTAGAATDVVTKSGTNDLHGSLYAFHTDQALDAQYLFLHVPRKPKQIWNNDGADLGGPIIKNKMFFYGNWDGYFQRLSAADTHTIPPNDMRSGNFTAYLGPKLFDSSGNPINVCTTEGTTVQLQQGMVFDPTTGNPANGTGRCVFSSGGQVNIIPASRMYAGALNYWKLLPQPAQGQTFTVNTPFNDIRARSSKWNRNIYTGKVDYDFSNGQRLWGKYTLQKALLNDGTDWGVAGQGSGTGITDDTAQTVTIGHSWTPKQTLVLTSHIGFTRMGEKNTTSDFGQELGQSVLELANSNTPLADKRYSGMPGIALSGFSTLGTSQSWEPVFRNDWQLTLDSNAAWIHGNHQVSFGVDAAHNHMNHWQPEIVCCPRGFVQANEFGTFLNRGTVYDSSGKKVGFNPDPWNSVALFDIGLATDVRNSQQFIRASNKDWQEALYIGDIWRVTPKLTVNAGLRWEYYPLITRDGVIKFEGYNPATGIESFGGVGNNPTHLGVTSSKADFAPRLGLAYRLNSDTVIRSGFGISYDTLPLERPLRGFYPLTIGAEDFVTGKSSITQYLPYSTFNVANNTANNIVGSPATASGLANGVPLIAAPTGFSSGSIMPPPDVTIGTLAPGEFHRGYVESWNFTVERKLPSDMLISVAYVGNHLVHQFNGVELNSAPLGTGSAGEPLFAAFGRFADTYAFQGYLDSHYNSLQVKLDRHLSNGLFLQGSYTYSKAIGYMDDEGWEDGLKFNCPASSLMPKGCQALNRHTLSFDHTHVLKMAFVYELPFGAGKRWANSNRAARAILGGWQTNGVFTAFSGSPLFPSQTSSFINTPFTGQNPDFVGPLQMIKQHGPGQFWFNTTAFQPVCPASKGCLDNRLAIGTAGRSLSWLRGPGLAQLDFSLFRHFKIKERYDLEARVETLNFTNTPHWNNPGTTCSIVTVNNQTGCGGSFGQISSSFGQRILQLGLVVTF